MMRAPHSLMVAAVAVAAAFLASLIDNDYYLRILLHDGRVLSVCGRDERVGRLRGTEIPRSGWPVRGRRIHRCAVDNQSQSESLAGSRSSRDRGCGVRRIDRLALVAGARSLSGHGDAGIRDRRRETGQRVDGSLRRRRGNYGIKSLALFGTPFGMLQWVWFVIALGVVTHLLLRNLLSGRFGRAFLSLQADEIAAESVGVSVYRYKILAFVIAAVTCGMAGAIVAQQNQYLNSDFISFNLSIFILLLVLFGGAGNLYGPLVGAILLTLIDALLARWPSIQHFVYGALLLFSLYVMPNGVAGLIKRCWRAEGALLARSKSKSVDGSKF